MSLGESILDHYELFLGKYTGVDKYTSGEYVIQLLGFDRTFKDCLTFASLGLSNYSNLINNSCEVIMPVDDDYDNCAVVFANALFYVLQQQMDFGRGTIIEGLDNIIADFSKRHNKTAIYFTESYVLPEEFSKIEDHLKMYIAFFISEKEAIKQIKKLDKYRKEYYYYHTGKKWENVKNYDLCIDTSKLGFEKSVKYIKEYIKLRMDS